MRAIVITLILAAAAAAGFYFYKQSAPASQSGGLFVERESAPLPTAEQCTALDAVYEYNSDARLQLRFQRIAQNTDAEFEYIGGRQVGNVNFVVHTTSLNTDYVFRPDNTFLSQGPRYQTVATFLRPAAGGERFQVSMFDSTMEYIDQLPRDTSTAPAYIYMPEMMRSLYRERIDLPPGAFRFLRCETPAPAPTATP